VTVRPACINASHWDNALEPDGGGGLALRLGFRQIKGMARDDADWIAAARGNGYRDVAAVWRRAGTPPRLLARLAEADAFAALGLDRRTALWQAAGLGGDAPLPLFDGLEAEEAASTAVLPPMTLGEEIVADYTSLRLTLRAHPMALLRSRLDALSAREARQDGRFRRSG
jgi:DNA polymerase-3 subunit alpha/error-prone DNA polymerase